MFVLASASKARQKLLDQIALRHKVIVSDFDETQLQEPDPILKVNLLAKGKACLLYTSPSPRDLSTSRMPSSA